MKLLRYFVCPVLIISILTISAFADKCVDKGEKKLWYDNAIEYCIDNKLLGEHLKEDEKVTENITWSLLIQTLSQITTNYSDAIYTFNEDKVYAPIKWAIDFGLIDESIDVSGFVSRSEAAKVLFLFFSKSNADITTEFSDSEFSDFLNISESYKDGVLFVEKNMLMKGYGNGNFGGNDLLNICQLAQILYNGENMFSGLSLNKIFSVEENQISYIELYDGNTGDKKTVYDREKISDVVTALNTFKFDSVEKRDSDGWSYGIELCFNSGEKTFCSLSENSVTINSIAYMSNNKHFSLIF